MKRQIKFRAWDKKANAFVYMTLTHGTCGATFAGDYHGELGPWRQFTGLYDKNGEEIWEGDVVRVFTCRNEKDEVWMFKPGYPPAKSWLAVVEFRDGAFVRELKKFEGLDKEWSIEAMNETDEEIIGNIENPELL